MKELQIFKAPIFYLKHPEKDNLHRSTPQIAHLISRSSACSENHNHFPIDLEPNGQAEVLERHQAAGTPAQP